MAKSIVNCIESLPDVARQKLLKSANAARSYSKNKSDTFFMDYGVEYIILTASKQFAYKRHIRIMFYKVHAMTRQNISTCVPISDVLHVN